MSGPSDPNLPMSWSDDLSSRHDDAAPLHDDAHLEPMAGSTVIPDPIGWTDTLTGAEGPKYWDRLISGERDRLRRHGRKVTVVLLELIGCDEIARAIGREAALQTFARLSRTLVSQIRPSDHVARIGTSRFGLLLVETDELQALNFIDRVLRHLRESIEREGRDVQVGVGWASPGPDDRLSSAITLAEERLTSDFFHTL